MAIKKTKRRNKKRGGSNKNRRNTKRNQRGGLIHEIKCDINGKNCTYDLLQFLDSIKYSKKFPIVPPNKKPSIFDFIPKNQDTGIDLFSGKTDDNKKKPIDRKSIKEVIYVRQKEDLEMMDLFAMMNNEESIKNAMINIFLSKPDLLKKTTILRILYKLYKGEELQNKIVYDRTRGNITIGEIKGDVNEITKTDHEVFFRLIIDTFKNKYRPDHSKEISTNIFKNGLLEDCYGDISETDVNDFMTIVIGNLSGNEKNKFSHIYSPENYDYIRQAILFYVINSQFEDFGKFIEAFKEVVESAKTKIQGSVDDAKIKTILKKLAKPIVEILHKKLDESTKQTDILKLVKKETEGDQIIEEIMKRVNIPEIGTKVNTILYNLSNPIFKILDNENNNNSDRKKQILDLVSKVTDDEIIIEYITEYIDIEEIIDKLNKIQDELFNIIDNAQNNSNPNDIKTKILELIPGKSQNRIVINTLIEIFSNHDYNN